MYQLLRNRLSPFRHKSFRHFFAAQTLSLTGTWSADLARAWLVISQFGNATALGGLLLASAIPGVLLILHGGVLVDRLDVRRLMMATKACLGIIALTLAGITEFGHLQYWHLLVFAFLEGTVNAFDSPAFQALIVKLVPRQDFQQALAISSTNFHFSRMLGPGVAGILMAVHGPSLVFVFDGLSYFGVVTALSGMKFEYLGKKSTAMASALASLWEGMLYMFRTPTIRYKVMQLILTIAMVFPLLLVVFRTLIKVKFNLDAQEFGYLFILPALGSMTGALSFAIIQPKVPIRALAFGVPGAALTILSVPFMPTALLSAIAMSFSGFFMYLTFASLTVSLQLELKEEFRGRVSSVVGLCFVGIGPLMGFPIGALGDQIGYAKTIEIMTISFLLLSGLFAFLYHRSQLRRTVKSAIS